MKRLNNWLNAWMLFTFIVGLITPVAATVVTRDWIWLIPTILGFILFVVGMVLEDWKKG